MHSSLGNKSEIPSQKKERKTVWRFLKELNVELTSFFGGERKAGREGRRTVGKKEGMKEFESSLGTIARPHL